MARTKKQETSAKTKKSTTRKTKTKKQETTSVEDKVNKVLEETPKSTETTESTESTESTEEKAKPVGTLFNVINYNNISDLDRFIQNLTSDQALYCVVQAARAAHQRSAYGMEESEVVSKAIRVLTTPPENKEQEAPEPEVHKA